MVKGSDLLVAALENEGVDPGAGHVMALRLGAPALRRASQTRLSLLWRTLKGLPRLTRH
jgi:hypothetical protein